MEGATSEERVLTVFADVHYYFSTPTPRPLSHRFDKASYFYLHRKKNPDGLRLEIANNVGKPEQDAFTGSLDSVTIRQTYQQPTMISITVDGSLGTAGTVASTPNQYPEHHWRLPNTDPRNEGKFLFRLHTLDVYFWTLEDANSSLEIIRSVLDPRQLDVTSNLPAHEEVMSPVVQKLENTAIQDPSYHNYQNRNSNPVLPLPSIATPVKELPSNVSNISDGKPTQAYQPLAYNPASPPAPEKIAHREKTPPPPESEAGTGLVAAAYHDQTQAMTLSPAQRPNSLSHQPYSQSPASQGYGSSYQSQTQISAHTSPAPPATYFGSPQSAQDQRTSGVPSFPPAPPLTSRTESTPYAGVSAHASPPSNFSNPQSVYTPSIIPSTGGPTKDPNAHLYSYDTRPPNSPATEILGNSYVNGPQQPLQHLRPQYADYFETRPPAQQPQGGYSSYNYDQSHQRDKPHSHHDHYGVHGEVYRPTEGEAHKHKHHKHSEGQQPGKLEQRAERVEKGLGRLLKKVEKKIG